jgi:hypothetical protein
MSFDESDEKIILAQRLIYELKVQQLRENLRSILDKILLEEEIAADEEVLIETLMYDLLEAKKKIDYKDAYRRWHSSKKAKRARAQRNKIRRQFEREGRVSKGDGKEIDHIVPKSKGGTDSRKNLRVVSRHTNRTKGSKMPKRKK